MLRGFAVAWSSSHSRRPDAVAWTRDVRGQYYLARVESAWEYWTSPEGQEADIDIGNIFRCKFCEVDLDNVPGKVVSSFGAPGRAIQRITDSSTRVYSQHLWNSYVGRRHYHVNLEHIPDIFTTLDAEETEDLVFLYLQSLGWYIVPNSRKGNTLRFEFMLAHSETGLTSWPRRPATDIARMALS